jgi:hypothetical protein
MQVNKALEHHKALLKTRQRMSRVSALILLTLLVTVQNRAIPRNFTR